MPPKSSLFMLLITCFFMHASNSRHLDLTNYKDFHRSKLSHKKTREENKLSVGVNFVSNPRGSTIDHSCRISNPSGVISLSKEDQYWALSKKGNQGANNSGNQDGKASLHKALQNATKSEVNQLNMY